MLNKWSSDSSKLQKERSFPIGLFFHLFRIRDKGTTTKTRGTLEALQLTAARRPSSCRTFEGLSFHPNADLSTGPKLFKYDRHSNAHETGGHRIRLMETVMFRGVIVPWTLSLSVLAVVRAKEIPRLHVGPRSRALHLLQNSSKNSFQISSRSRGTLDVLKE